MKFNTSRWLNCIYSFIRSFALSYYTVVCVCITKLVIQYRWNHFQSQKPYRINNNNNKMRCENCRRQQSGKRKRNRKKKTFLAANFTSHTWVILSEKAFSINHNHHFNFNMNDFWNSSEMVNSNKFDKCCREVVPISICANRRYKRRFGENYPLWILDANINGYNNSIDYLNIYIYRKQNDTFSVISFHFAHYRIIAT